VHQPPTASNPGEELGSALMLLPAITLIVVILTAIVINTAALYLEQHQLTEVAEACALRGTRALDPTSYYSQGRLALDPYLATTDINRCVSQATTTSTEITVSFPSALSLTVALSQPQQVPLMTLLNIDRGTVAAKATASIGPATQSALGPLATGR